MGLVPAVLNLPVSWTQTEDASAVAVNNARGTFIGWTLPHVETACLQTVTDPAVVLEQVTDPDVVLEQRPTLLLI